MIFDKNILRFHLAGQWEPSQVTATWVQSSHIIPPGARQLIEQAWQSAAARPGIKLFDGPMCRLEGWSLNAADPINQCGLLPLAASQIQNPGVPITDGTVLPGNDVAAPFAGAAASWVCDAASGADRCPGSLKLALSRTSYKMFLGTNMSHPELADRFGPQVLANPVGVSPALETADGFLMLGRRNARVAYYPNRVHPFAGCLEPIEGNTGLGELGPDVFAAVRRELSEELGLGETDVPLVRFTGIAEDVRLRQPEMIFRVKTTLTRTQIEAQVARDEHHASWSVPTTQEAVAASLADPELTPVALAALLLWGRIAFGPEWFARHTAQGPTHE